MSDVSQGPGWWQASDGKWYSPDQVPAGWEGAPQGTPPGTGYGTPPSEPGYPQSGYGYPQPGYPQPGYGYPPGGYGYVAPSGTNGLAVASMVCSFFFWIWGLGAILAIVFGFVARSQIKRTGGTQKGAGMALAGIIIGFAGLAIGIVLVVVIATTATHCNQTGGCTFTTG